MKVRIGVAIAGERVVRLDQLGDVLADLERFGFDSVWLPETFLGGTFDPIVALSYAAARVSRLKLGTHLVAPGRNPVVLARSLAQLDRLSNGRLLLVFVPGLPDTTERAIQGMPAGDRNVWFDEHLDELRTLWRGEAVRDATLESPPVQRPLEVWLGGKAQASLERAGRLSDGWLAGFMTIDEALAARSVIERAAAGAGRVISPEHFGVNIAYTLSDALPATPAPLLRRRPDGDGRDVVAVGSVALKACIARWVDAGFSKIVVRPIAAPENWTIELDALADAVVALQT